jgi:hypothetical protein
MMNEESGEETTEPSRGTKRPNVWKRACGGMPAHHTLVAVRDVQNLLWHGGERYIALSLVGRSDMIAVDFQACVESCYRLCWTVDLQPRVDCPMWVRWWAVDRPIDGDGWKEMWWDERSLSSTLEDGLAQTHTLLHLPAEQTA